MSLPVYTAYAYAYVTPGLHCLCSCLCLCHCVNQPLAFKSVDNILWRNHLNETSSAVPLHGTIRFSIFYYEISEFFLNFDFGHSRESKD